MREQSLEPSPELDFLHHIASQNSQSSDDLSSATLIDHTETVEINNDPDNSSTGFNSGALSPDSLAQYEFMMLNNHSSTNGARGSLNKRHGDVSAW